jgi:hypothetical protein
MSDQSDEELDRMCEELAEAWYTQWPLEAD